MTRNRRPRRSAPQPSMPQLPKRYIAPLPEEIRVRLIPQVAVHWEIAARRATFWAALLNEIPRALAEHEAVCRQDIFDRIEFLRQHFRKEEVDGDVAKRLVRLEAPPRCMTRPSSDSVWACTVAMISRDYGQWPDHYTASVEFAFCNEGGVKSRCTNVKEGHGLPAVLEAPTHDREIAEKVRDHVRHAIRLVDVNDF